MGWVCCVVEPSGLQLCACLAYECSVFKEAELSFIMRRLSLQEPQTWQLLPQLPRVPRAHLDCDVAAWNEHVCSAGANLLRGDSRCEDCGI